MILNYSLSFKVLDQFVLEFNNEQQSIGTKIRQSMLSTAKEIFKIYGATLLNFQKEQAIDLDNLPFLSTNSEQLATMTHATGRTIRRHVKRLLDSKILVEKKWHGSHHNYELFINPKLLWINGVGIVDKGAKESTSGQKIPPENQSVANTIGTKCPHSEPYKKTNKRNNKLIAVEKLQEKWQVKSEEEQAITDKKTDKTVERSPLSLPNFEFTEKKTKKITEKTRWKDLSKKGARRKDAWREDGKSEENPLLEEQTSVKIVKPPHGENVGIPRISQAGILIEKDWQSSSRPKTRHAFLSHYIQELWQLAKSVLYEDVWLCKRQCDLAISLLYQWYKPVAEEKLEYVHEVYKIRVRIAREYVDRDPQHRFIMLPEAYFDPKTKGGFTGTKSWYEEEKQYRKTQQFKKILCEQIRKFRNNENRNNSMARPRLTVYKECEKHIAALQIPELLKAFYKAVLDPKSKEYPRINFKK